MKYLSATGELPDASSRGLSLLPTRNEKPPAPSSWTYGLSTAGTATVYFTEMLHGPELGLIASYSSVLLSVVAAVLVIWGKPRD
jgi:hypothetical protein